MSTHRKGAKADAESAELLSTDIPIDLPANISTAAPGDIGRDLLIDQRAQGSMNIVFFCRSCGSRFEVDPRASGKQGRCKKCGQRMTVPKAGEVASMASMPALAMAGVGAPAGTGAAVGSQVDPILGVFGDYILHAEIARVKRGLFIMHTSAHFGARSRSR